MDGFGAVRALARTKHNEMRTRAGGAVTAAALLAAARDAERITTQVLPPEHPLLGGGDGALRRESRAIYISSAALAEAAAFVEAHEFGHLWIETPADPAIVSRGADPGAPEEPTPLGLRRVEAYSAQELRERYANVFGREFLLPRDEARRRFINEGQSGKDIAAALGVPIRLVYQQLAASLLLPDTSPIGLDRNTSSSPGLDQFQREAAEHLGSPLLVEAGPGTGKTRTLIARIEHLLRQGVSAGSILVLTFSNKAAREIQERVASSMPVAAAELWAGTFHAFGLELLRKFGGLIALREPIRLLDQADALALLERDLAALELEHYLLLHEPLLELRNILGAISRAKDEMFSPEEYAAAAQRMAIAADASQDNEQGLCAAKASEVARVYAHYERLLRDTGVVDFADLINRSVKVIRSHPDIREALRTQYQHVLVDEYQDVNRASAHLLKELAGDGERLWVVGDARQSIYRFRGASPVNTRNFEKDYPTGVRKPLGVNYRSRRQIVDAFTAYAVRMRVGQGRSAALQAHRGDDVTTIDFNMATDFPAEIAGIARAIERQRADGIGYRNQAVLCRSHSYLERIALGLEQAGIPVLYLGDLFERPEVRDLLALLSFVAEPHRGGLFRLAARPEYQAPLADVRALLKFAHENGLTPQRGIQTVTRLSELSEEGRAAFQRLSADLGEVAFGTGPGTLLCDFLFNQSSLLRRYLSGESAADQQRRLALYQFLQFAIENDATDGGDPKRRLLDWVRRLEMFGDERALREVPAAVADIDAVRLMTVHASKGLEFRAVHLPVLGNGMFPASWRGQRCPAPEGMLPTRPSDDHAEEEECLFYVALSRAQDFLSLSRAERYSDNRTSNASPALEAIAPHLPHSTWQVATWTGDMDSGSPLEPRTDLAVHVREHDGRDIELYLACPRRYLYQVILGLSGSREDNGYVRFHRVVYKVLHWMSGQSAPAIAAELWQEFDRHWAETGPTDHPLEELYRTVARRILEQAAARPRDGIRVGEQLRASVGGHTIRLLVDEIVPAGGQFVVRRLRTGRPPSKPDQRVLHALMVEAARQILGGCRFELHYLTTNEAVAPSFTRVMAARLKECTEVLEGLAAGRFPATPDDRDACPRCPHYFICPAVPV